MKQGLLSLLTITMVLTIGQFASADVRIKNFRLIPFFFENATGVSRFHPEIEEYYNSFFTKFPKYGNLEELKVDYIFSNVSYSSFVCKRMIEQDAKLASSQRRGHKLFDFDKSVRSQTDAAWNESFDYYSSIFWFIEPSRQDADDFLELAGSLKGTFSDTKGSNAPTLMALCSLVASSFNATLD
ncbi:MAG: hypothetical protein KDD25_02995 [Bdellovibrionales bacterium]|nr:hypothetical protein [Bdellovibrionales bacterium]